MPIEMNENNRHIGMAADFLEMLGRKTDLEFELFPTPTWGASLDAAKKHLCDILSAAEDNEVLSENFHFTDPYMEFPIVIIARKNMPFISSLESIKDQSVATLADAEYIELLNKRYPQMKIRRMNTTKEGLQAVRGGKIDYFLDITADLVYVTRKYNIDGLNIAGFTGDDFHFRVAVRKDNPVLFAKLQSAVQHISEVEKQKIYNRWIDTDIETATNYSHIWKILALSLFGFILFFFWNRRLSGEISKRQKAEKQLLELNESLEVKIEEQISKMRESDLILHQQSRLAQTGELLSNIAHQWRQPLARLSALFMQAELKTKQGTLEKDELQTLIEQNNSIVEHMSQTLEDFTHFFQLDSKQRVWFDPLEPCKEALGIISGTLQSNDIMLHKSCPKMTQKLYGYPRAFSHVILLLLNNANDVLKKRNSEEADIWIKMTIDSKYLTITVEDNGGGIDEEIITKIFDPYFTTKPKEEGTGIGLYLASTIIQRIFHGTISVSNSSKGAKFLIEIPLKT
jgi:signal transduction histidine kinase